MRTGITQAFSAVIVAAAVAGAAAHAKPAPYLYAWAGDEDEKDSDFLAVVDADPASKRFGQVVATAPTVAKANMPHHIE
jgi:hypothetical protein